MFTQAQINAIVAAFTQAMQSLVSQEPGKVAPPPPPPPVDPRAAEIARLEAAIAILKQPASEPQPATVATTVRLTWRADNNGYRVDNVVPRGTFGTVLAPVTGHVFSLPQPGTTGNPGEGFNGYVRRVYEQAGANEAQRDSTGRLLQGTAHLFQRFGGWKADGSNWHLAADLFYNPLAYASDEDRESERRANEAWVEYDRVIKARQAALQPPVLPDEDVPIGS